MDVVKAVQHYVEKMISDVPGMKVLLLDTMTVRTYLQVDYGWGPYTDMSFRRL